MKKRLFVFSSIALAIAGCAQVPTTPMSRGVPVSINGATGYLGGKYNLAGFEQLPPVKTLEDVRALGRMAKGFGVLSQQKFAQGDFAAAVLANHMAARLAEYQLIVKGSSRYAMDAAARNKNGVIQLAPGDLAILPMHQGVPSPSVYRGAFSNWPHGMPVQVAALGGVGGIGQMEQQQRDYAGRSWYEQLPIGQIVTLENGVVVERTADSMVLHNPGARPASVNPGDLGYMPPIAPYSPERKAASPMIRNIVSEANRLFQTNFNATQALPKAPNAIQYDREYKLDRDGMISTSQKDQAIAKREYEKKGSPFQIAMDLSSSIYRSSEWNAMTGQCFQPGANRALLSAVSGEFSDRATLTCAEGRSGSPVHAKTFFLGQKGMLQTWNSLMEDQAVAKKLKEYDENIDSLSTFTQMLPLAGSFESGMKCIDAAGIPELLSKALPTVRSANQARSFVTNIYDVSAKQTNMALRALDCASTIPGLAIGTKLAPKAGLFADFLAQNGQSLAKGLGMFETSVLTGKGFQQTGELISAFGTGPGSAMALAKVTYDGIQTSRSFVDFSNAMQVVLR